MNVLPNFELKKAGMLSDCCHKFGIQFFHPLCEHIRKLNYGRNSSKTDLSLVLEEQIGTCSTKHALLAQVAKEQKVAEIKLILGIYKMKPSNTAGIELVLDAAGLDYLPEAHNYLKVGTQRFDFTGLPAGETSPFDALLKEIEINPSDIGEEKVRLHKDFLKAWIKQEELNFSLDEIWAIRERCIAALATSS